MVGLSRALTAAGLAELLADDEPLFAEDAHRRWLLTLPPFRPAAGDPLAARARALVARPTATPGAVLLAGEHRGEGSLFWLAPGQPAARLVPFRGEAREQVELAHRVVPRALPALVEPTALDVLPVGARRAVLGATDPGALDGASFGLGIALALASSLLDEPVPADLVAMARLDEAGACLGVGHLEAKLDVVTRWALAARRVLVAGEQGEETRRIAEARGMRVTVVPVESLAAALRESFGDIERLLRARWTAQPERAERAARALLSLARDGYHRLLDWSAVASAAGWLREHLPEGEHRVMAALAQHIATRHSDAPRPLAIPEAWLSAQPRPFRLKLWAHFAQSAADGAEWWEAPLTRAAAQLATPGDEHPEDLELAGALGRAHAARFEHADAVQLLLRAAQGWSALERAHDAAHPVAELLRIAAATGDSELARRVRPHGEAVLCDPRALPVARVFVRLALGRASVQLGDPLGALDELGDRAAPWSHAPAHARAARLRWQAQAMALLDRAAASRELRAQLSREHRDGEGRVVTILARLDAGEDARAEVLAHPLLARELARLEDCLAPSSDAAALELLRRYSRY